MISSNDIELVLSTSVNTPAELFSMVMEYAERTGKNKWECFGEAFSPMSLSIMFKHKVLGVYIGYCSIKHMDDNTLFFNHGLMLHPVSDPANLMANIHTKILACNMAAPKKLIIHSELPSRLWRNWGFKESKVKIFERDMGGSNHGK